MGARGPGYPASWGGTPGRGPSGLDSSLSRRMGGPHRLTGGPEAMLECCRVCSSLLAHPVRWRRLGPDTWEIELRCPDCEHGWREIVPTAAMKRFDDVLKEGRAEIERYLGEIERIDFAERIEAFITALDAGAIFPEDFGRPTAG